MSSEKMAGQIGGFFAGMTWTLIVLAVWTNLPTADSSVGDNKPNPLPTPAVTEIASPRAAHEPEIWNVSAYCPCEKCCGKYSKGKHYRQTANGYKILPGDQLIAAPKSVPFGTWITVPGYGRAQVKDRGGAIKEGCLDLYFSTHKPL